MKVVHVPFTFRPDPVGGTEVYVEALARAQQQRGMEVVVAAPAPVSAYYRDAGLPIRRFSVSHNPDLRTLYGGGDERAGLEFERLLDDEQPDVVHLHAFTSAVSRIIARRVARRRIPLLFTYHTPTVTCQRGTLMRWGRDVCDGRLDVRTCTSCTLHGLGVARWMSIGLSEVPSAVGVGAGRLGLSGGVWTGIRMTELIGRQHEAFYAFISDVHRIVVLCSWVADLLVRNGIPAQKLVLSRHGLPVASLDVPRAPPRANGRPLRVAFVGRLHPTKGLDTLVRALRGLPELPARLDVYGVIDQARKDGYSQWVQDLASGDARVVFRNPVPSADVVRVLTEYDVVAVPSRWLETGPLVVLEAFAAGVPVVGSRLGGIEELVEDGVSGVLVDVDSVKAWQRALNRLWQKPEVLAHLRAGIPPPRSIEAVAQEMATVYEQLLCRERVVA
jgi:glycosyltransferase involved in cell wall biosynthesis